MKGIIKMIRDQLYVKYVLQVGILTIRVPKKCALLVIVGSTREKRVVNVLIVPQENIPVLHPRIAPPVNQANISQKRKQQVVICVKLGNTREVQE